MFIKPNNLSAGLSLERASLGILVRGIDIARRLQYRTIISCKCPRCLVHHVLLEARILK